MDSIFETTFVKHCHETVCENDFAYGFQDVPENRGVNAKIGPIRSPNAHYSSTPKTWPVQTKTRPGKLPSRVR